MYASPSLSLSLQASSLNPPLTKEEPKAMQGPASATIRLQPPQPPFWRCDILILHVFQFIICISDVKALARVCQDCWRVSLIHQWRSADIREILPAAVRRGFKQPSVLYPVSSCHQPKIPMITYGTRLLMKFLGCCFANAQEKCEN